MPQPDPPDQRILGIAEKVDALVVDVGNLQRFREQIKVFAKELADRPGQDSPFRPGRRPSLSTMVTLLADVHDDYLPDSPAIFDPPIADPKEVFGSQEKGRRAMWRACFSFMMSEDIAPSRAVTLEGYLNRVRHWLGEDARQAGGDAAAVEAEPGGNIPLGLGLPRQAARQEGGGKMDTSETASAIRDFLLEHDPDPKRNRLRAAYRKAKREYMQWASQIDHDAKAKGQALKRIDEQQRRGHGPLINREKCPGRGWVWKENEHYLRAGHSVAVKGWVPPAVARQSGKSPDWPPREPSLETRLAALAVFHDLVLSHTEPLMDYRGERPDAPGSFLWFLQHTFNVDGVGIESLDEPMIDARGLQLAQSYLAHARVGLRAEKVKKMGLSLAGSKRPTVMTADAAAPPLGKINVQRGRTDSGMKQRFSFSPGQVMLDGHDLGLPAGLPVEVLRELVSNFGRVVPHQKLHHESHESEATEQLRDAIRAIRKALKSKRVRCEVVSKRGAGYLLT
jgi:hypothetical protein